MKKLLLVCGLTIACASCSSNCGEDDHQPQVVNVKPGAGSTAMTKPRVLLAREAAEDAAAPPPPR